MKRIALAACVCLSLFTFTACGSAADGPGSAEADSSGGEVLAQDSLQAFIHDTTDTEPLMDFANANFQALMHEMSGPSEIAQKHIEGIRESVADVDPGDNEQAAGLLNSIKRSLEAFEFRLVAKGLSLDEVKATVTKDPANTEAINLYIVKLGMTFMEDMNEDIEKMESFVKTENDFIDANVEKVEASDVKITYRKAGVVLQSATQEIERLKAYAELVGKEMLPIDAQAWANGDGLSAEDLKGKVVLLDFWAVWCGPCVASFPHLVEWQEKYGKDGLQIVGITRYFNFNWPEGAEGPQQGEGQVPPTEENAMLDKFTAEHNLKHPTAVLDDTDAFYSYYAVSGIPHFVLIGRDGKIHKVNSGISESRAKKLEEEIQKLLDESAPE
ncbi:TlpA family protein disulfide reductase [Bremerella sp. P1]|uniref:TlpA family protein disulfide reductase n=1 Tax=Bremerella sp. P1 TaxID=3026424 RepID=UPI002367AA2A|nr:TlpA disulfide reductase family protein [Bremerella sp. P1]WDI44327.1 TlpA disulfide reductase family protein [Bremerella sp. P1]